MRYIKLQHEITNAQYDEPSGKWKLKLRRPVGGSSGDRQEYEIIEDSADFVLAGVGSLSRWFWPDIDGLNDFKGKLIHTAGWETDESGWWHSSVTDWGDKRVGVIGSVSSSFFLEYCKWSIVIQESTATQVVPALQPRVKHLYNYVRGKTWLSPPFLGDKMSEIMRHDQTSANR